MAAGILIWGAGAIGGIAGAYLARAGHAVTLVDTNAAHVAAIRGSGLRISGPIDDFVVPAPAVLPDEVLGKWPRVLLAVKAQHTEAACRALLPHLAEDGFVLSLQNGLCAPAMRRVVGAHRALGSLVHYAGDWLAPGHILFGMRGPLVIGEFDGRLTPRLTALESILRAIEPEAEATADLSALIWSKLCFTALMIAQALGQASIVECLGRPELLPLWRKLVGEMVAVARTEGVEPRALDGLDPAAFAPAGSQEAARASVDEVIALNRRGAKTHSGFWRDIAVRKRATEAPAQLGPVIDIARSHGLACPALMHLAAMIAEIEAGARVQTDDNLLELASTAR